VDLDLASKWTLSPDLETYLAIYREIEPACNVFQAADDLENELELELELELAPESESEPELEPEAVPELEIEPEPAPAPKPKSTVSPKPVINYAPAPSPRAPKSRPDPNGVPRRGLRFPPGDLAARKALRKCGLTTRASTSGTLPARAQTRGQDRQHHASLTDSHLAIAASVGLPRRSAPVAGRGPGGRPSARGRSPCIAPRCRSSRAGG
jgi:hypothetical protein